MLKLKQKTCKCGKLAMRNRRICYQCWLAAQRKKREAKLAKQAESKAKKKARFEQGETYRKRLFKKAWKVFSLYIRQKYADIDGMVHCYTCPTVKHFKDMQAGHLWHGKLDFDERNIHPQCYQCNVGHSGRREVYSANLLEEGIDLKQLRRDAEEKGNDYSIAELKEIIDKFTK